MSPREPEFREPVEKQHERFVFWSTRHVVDLDAVLDDETVVTEVSWVVQTRRSRPDIFVPDLFIAMLDGGFEYAKIYHNCADDRHHIDHRPLKSGYCHGDETINQVLREEQRWQLKRNKNMHSFSIA